MVGAEESVLYRTIGDTAAMREQLHLASTSRLNLVEQVGSRDAFGTPAGIDRLACPMWAVAALSTRG